MTPAVTQVNSIRPRYTNRSGQAAGKAEANTDYEATSNCSSQAPRGDWRQRASREQSRHLGGPPSDPSAGHVDRSNKPQESITAAWLSWESERGIRAEKPGNAGGAKAPWQKHACPHNVRITRLDQRPTTEDPRGYDDSTANTQPVKLHWWSLKSKVKLPVRVAELRRKLYQKAKHEASEPTVHRQVSLSMPTSMTLVCDVRARLGDFGDYTSE